MIEELFTFPIVMVDGENEEKKMRRGEGLGLDTDEDLDIVIGEAELPYFDFMGITDRWLPNNESLQDAMSGKFDACYVIFANMGGFVVPWSKNKFKAKIKDFEQEFIKKSKQKRKASIIPGMSSLPNIPKIELSPEKTTELMNFLQAELKNQKPNENKEDGQSDQQ